jgi:nicotinamidase-related amidase
MGIAEAAQSTLLVVDFQARLMPAIAAGGEAVAQARRLIAAARLLGVPVVYTEQNPRGLGGTVEEIAPAAGEPVLAKMTFDAWRSPEVRAAAPAGHELIVAGCEAHVCVLQTVLGALVDGRRVKVVADAIGSRREASRAAALERMSRHGAEIVTAEMVVFEWLGSAAHPAFKEAIALVK